MTATFRYDRWKILGELIFIVGSIGLAIWMCVLAATGGATIRGHDATAFIFLISIAWSALASVGLVAYAPCLVAPFAVRVEPGMLHVFAGIVGWPPRLVETRLQTSPGAVLVVHDYGVASEAPLSAIREEQPVSTRGVYLIWRLVKDQAGARAAVEAMSRAEAA
jgi:hypothetical protein